MAKYELYPVMGDEEEIEYLLPDGVIKLFKSYYGSNFDFADMIDELENDWIHDEKFKSGYIVFWDKRNNEGFIIKKEDWKKLQKNKIEESKQLSETKETYQIEGTNLEIVGFDMDTNGNKVVKLQFPDEKVFSIQVGGGNISTLDTQSINKVNDLYKLKQKELDDIEWEIIDYIQHYGSSNQKSKLKVYESVQLNEANLDVKKELENYIVDVQAEDDAYFEKFLPNLASKGLNNVYEYTESQKYYKVILTNNGGNGQKSVFAFIDKINGDIYKPASWNTPAKGVRGNIFDKNKPLSGKELYR